MDSDLPDFTIINGSASGALHKGAKHASARGGDRPVIGLRAGAEPGVEYGGDKGGDTLARLAASLSPAARRACVQRVARRGLVRFSDASDPCTCGEATLLAMVASALPGRAPADAFRSFGGPQ